MIKYETKVRIKEGFYEGREARVQNYYKSEINEEMYLIELENCLNIHNKPIRLFVKTDDILEIVK